MSGLKVRLPFSPLGKESRLDVLAELVDEGRLGDARRKMIGTITWKGGWSEVIYPTPSVYLAPIPQYGNIVYYTYPYAFPYTPKGDLVDLYLYFPDTPGNITCWI